MNKKKILGIILLLPAISLFLLAWYILIRENTIMIPVIILVVLFAITTLKGIDYLFNN